MPKSKFKFRPYEVKFQLRGQACTIKNIVHARSKAEAINWVKEHNANISTATATLFSEGMRMTITERE